MLVIPMLSRTPWKVRGVFTAALLAIVFCAAAHAQDFSGYEDDDDDVPAGSTAALSVSYDARGTADATITADTEIANWAPLQAALEQALHFPAGSLRHPEARQYPWMRSGGAAGRLQAKRTAQLQAADEQYRARTMLGSCPAAMTHHGFMLETDLRFDPVLAELQRAGEQRLEVYVSYRASRFVERSSHRLRHDPGPEYVAYHLDVANPAPPIHLQYGLTRAEALSAAALPIAVLLLPLGIVLWMRSAAIEKAEQDPTAAWFGYLRTLNWCTTGVILVWLVGQSVRAGAEDLAAYYLAAEDARAAALKVALLLLPPWMVCLACILSSYRVYVHVRGSAWTRREFFATHFSQIAAQLLPLMCLFYGLELIGINSRLGLGMFVSSFFLAKILTLWRLKVSKTHPEALTTGELRDRVFELAKKAAVELRQIFIMPAEKSLMANAFASRNGVVIFTDYLLQRLNKREVSAVAAHEITHLERKHVVWRMVAILAVMFSPAIFRAILSFALQWIGATAPLYPGAGLSGASRAAMRIQSLPELDLIFFLLGLGLFYLLARHQENVADAGAVRLTGDPEAVITGLLKLGRLNLLPVQWGRLSGSLLTHPSTWKRVQRVARVGQVSPERLQQLVMQQQAAAEPVPPSELGQSEDSFSMAQAKPAPAGTTARATQAALYKLWTLWFFHIAPPALVAWGIGRWQLRPAVGAYLVGAMACVALYFLVTCWIGLWGRERKQASFQSKLQAQEIRASGSDCLMVGYSPAAETRYYLSGFDWDNGYLFFTRDRLCYIGAQVRFSLTPQQLREVRLAPGAPGWLAVPRLYVDWWDDASSTVRTWNMASLMPCSFWELRKQARELCDAVQRWKRQSSNYADAPAAMAELPPPQTGEVTSHPLQYVYSFRRWLRMTFGILFLSVAVGSALSLPGQWYISGVILVLRIYELIPYWFYKRPQPAAQPAPMVAVAKGDEPA